MVIAMHLSRVGYAAHMYAKIYAKTRAFMKVK